MNRDTRNVIVEQNGRLHRESPMNAPAQETVNARVSQLGPFRAVHLNAGLSAVPLPRGGVDGDAPTSALAHSAGQVVALVYRLSTPVAAGGAAAAQMQVAIGAGGAGALTGKGDLVAVAVGGQVAVQDVTPVSFKRGDALGVLLTTSGSFAPTTTNLDVDLVVRYAPSSGSPA